MSRWKVPWNQTPGQVRRAEFHDTLSASSHWKQVQDATVVTQRKNRKTCLFVHHVQERLCQKESAEVCVEKLSSLTKDLISSDVAASAVTRRTDTLKTVSQV